MRGQFITALLLAGSLHPAYGQTVSTRTSDVSERKLQVVVRMPLSLAANQVDGELQLLEDARITTVVQQKYWQMGPIAWDGDQPDPVFSVVKPLNAVLRVMSRDGSVVDSNELERPLAKLQSAKLQANTQLTYLLTVDYSAGFGSYSGPITTLQQVKTGRIERLDAVDRKTGKIYSISLMDSLKTTWKFQRSPTGGKEILLASCRPADWGSAQVDFETTYLRYYFRRGKWFQVYRTTKGINEFDGGFPSRSHFP